MTEADLKKTLTETLRHGGAMVIRFEDKFTAGIPDLWCAASGCDLWCEVKLDDHLFEPRRWKALKLQQVVLADRMSQHTGRPVWFLCYSPRTRTNVLVPASTLLAIVQDELPIPASYETAGNGARQLLKLLKAV